MPTADQIAMAIVAACKETTDDPIATASRYWRGATGGANRARHYALHALIAVFPEANQESLCRAVGCCGKAKMFLNSSFGQVLDKAKWWDNAALDRVTAAISDGYIVSVRKERSAFTIGDLIKHPSYGEGKVVEIGAYNARRRDWPLYIEFASGRVQMMYEKVVGTFRIKLEPTLPEYSEPLPEPISPPTSPPSLPEHVEPVYPKYIEPEPTYTSKPRLSGSDGPRVAMDIPPPSPAKITLQEMLRQAVENTVKMQQQ